MTTPIRKSSLSVTYDTNPGPVPMPEPDPMPQPGEPTFDLLEGDTVPAPKKRGRPPGTKNRKKKRKKLPLFTIWRVVFWASVTVVSVVSLYRGVQGLVGASAAYLTLAVAVVVSGYLLDRDWKKIRNGK